MAKINLNDIQSIYDLTQLNQDFTDIEAEFQNKVLYRDNPDGEPNQMENALDMNSNRILNLPKPVSNSEAARLADVQAGISGNQANLIEYNDSNVQEALDKRTIYVGSVAELEALSLPVGTNVYLTEEGRAGEFVVKTGTPPSDPQKGIYIVLANGNYAERSNKNSLTPYMFGAADGVESSAEIQAFWDYVAANSPKSIDVGGSFLLSSGIVIDIAAAGVIEISGILNVTATAGIDTIVTLESIGQGYWSGGIIARGTGSAVLADRTCRTGIKVSGASGFTARTSIEILEGYDVYEWGVEIGTLSTFMKIDKIDSANCGSGNTPQSELVANYSGLVNSGADTSTGQRTTITVDVLPLDGINGPIFIKSNGRLHYVYSIDRTASELIVYPKMNNTSTTGTLNYVFGGGVYIQGSDASCLRLGGVDSSNCGIGLFSAPLYGPEVGSVICQANIVGVAYGLSPSSAMIGFVVGLYYPEVNDFDIVGVTSAASGISFRSTVEMPSTGLEETASPRNDLGETVLAASSGLNGAVIRYRNQSFDFKRSAYGALPSTPIFDIGNKVNEFQVYEKDSGSISLTCRYTELVKKYGQNIAKITFVGSAADGAPSGAITIAGASGFTVNGVASSDFTETGKPLEVVLILDIDASNFKVYKV